MSVHKLIALHLSTPPHRYMCVDEGLKHWFLDGTVLRPTAEYLRQHVYALSNFNDPRTVEFQCADNRTITISHAHLSCSPLSYLGRPIHLRVDASSKVFNDIQKFVYCTPIDLSGVSVAFVETVKKWRLYELYAACFQVAETTNLEIVPLVKKYIPLFLKGHATERFKSYLAGRIAVDATGLVDWVRSPSLHNCESNQTKLQKAITSVGMKNTLENAMLRYSDLEDLDSLQMSPSNISFGGRETVQLVWRIPLAKLLAESRDYVEIEQRKGSVLAAMEVTWNAAGLKLVFGVQEMEPGLTDIHAAAIGLPCGCADQKHNTGWVLGGGVEEKTSEWIMNHDVGFTILSKEQLREWENVHNDCGLLLKVRVIIGPQEEYGDGNNDSDSTDDLSNKSCDSFDGQEYLIT